MTTNNNCLPCDGIQVISPLPISNRPALDAIQYRIGTHSTFFESLLARISTLTAEELAELSLSDNQRTRRRRVHKPTSLSTVQHPLRDWLTTREQNDPAIALLDAWSTVADILTFYQERLANEGFLRTARDRASIRELARLVGYRLRPGVAATVYLAFEVEDTNVQIPFGNGAPTQPPSVPIVIPKGTAAKSTPTPGRNEESQTFETSKDLTARREWNAIRPRQTRPQLIVASTLPTLERVYLNGIGLQLSPNNVMAFLVEGLTSPTFFRVQKTTEFPHTRKTLVEFVENPLQLKALTRNIRQVEAQLYDSLQAQFLSDQMKNSIVADIATYIQTTIDALGLHSIVAADQRVTDDLACTVLRPVDPFSPTFIRECTRLYADATSKTGSVPSPDSSSVLYPLHQAIETFRTGLHQRYHIHSVAMARLAALSGELIASSDSTFNRQQAATIDAKLKLAIGAIDDQERPVTVIG
ncbi:MAG TPA: hypothetical protein VGM98_15640, partial [Schlesneria sp.]